MNNAATGKISWSYITGILLIAAGFLAAALNAYFLMIGFSVFFAGSVFVLISRKSFNLRILTIIIPVIAFFLYYFVMYQKSKMEPASYIIPVKYRGEVNIIFDEPCGSEAKYREERRLYEIPSTGILITRFNGETGVPDNEYFFADSIGNMRRLEHHSIDEFSTGNYTPGTDRQQRPSADEVFVIELGRGNFSRNNEKPASFEKLMVCSYNEMLIRYNEEYERAFDSTRYWLLKQCREKNSK